jgi:phosphoribosylamine--glycine ligase
MQTYDIKTAKAVVFDSYNEAKEYIQTQQYPLVIKASGLAGGKGVVICDNLEEAEATIHDFMIRRIYGDAGIRLVIEEYLQGLKHPSSLSQTVKNYSLVLLQKIIKSWKRRFRTQYRRNGVSGSKPGIHSGALRRF